MSSQDPTGAGQAPPPPPAQPPPSGQPFAQPAPPGAPVGPAGPPAPARTTNGLAITSLILGIAGFFLITIPVNLVLGIVALVRTRKQGQKGTGLAITGIVLSLLWIGGIAAGVAVINDATEPERNAGGEISAEGSARLDALKVGDCVSQLGQGEIENVRVVPCGTAEDGRVVAILDLPAGAWPGDAEADRKASDECTSRYQASGGQEDQPSDLLYIRPNELSWKLGDRRVICVVTAAG